MLREIYLRPVGLFPAALHDRAKEVWGGLPLAGGWLDFAAVEVIERNGARIDRYISGLGELLERDWGRRTLNAADLFEALRLPRPRLAGLALDYPRIMAVAEVQPGLRNTDASLARGLALVAAGADIVEVGVTRDAVSELEETRLAVSVVAGLHAETEARIAIRSMRASVMSEAAAAGADLIIDPTAFMADPRALETAARLGLPIILPAVPRTEDAGGVLADCDDAALAAFDFLEARIDAAGRAGIPRDRIVVDPGTGIDVARNLALMSALSLYHGLGVPMSIGIHPPHSHDLSGPDLSSKDDTAAAHDIGTALAAIAHGAQIIRTTDVRAVKAAIDTFIAANAGRTRDDVPIGR